MIGRATLTHALAAVAAAYAAPPEPLKGQILSAIWADLQLNATIGNDNGIASLWYQAGSGTAPDLHIQDLACIQKRSQYRCAFVLHRDGGPKTISGQAAPARLACTASFHATDEAWSVVHEAPRRMGHSRTSMLCKSLSG